ncbi:LOW QUALITY PROTEIN: acetyl-CoA carboxylase, biotin carboxylase subunit, partial [Micromonospora sp. M42]
MFDKVLIANRGEIALRVLRACRELGVRTVVVHSSADADSLPVRLADEAVRIGPAASRRSYLNAAAIVEAARQTGAQAVHPGYGFLSEDADFAEICAENGLVFVGPPPQVMAALADKSTARALMSAAGLPLPPGSVRTLPTVAEAQEVAADVGYPVIVKAAAGGGGRGMTVVRSAAELPRAYARTRAAAQVAFGDDRVYVERYLADARHVEVQVLCDGQGNGVHLGTRDCSVQRRHQKLIEEAPAPALRQATLDTVAEVALRGALSVGFTGAGTVEFLVDEAERCHFLEINCRIQVEHPVTEMVTGVDLVQEQLHIAYGTPLRLRQSDVRLTGVAIECRVNVEDPDRDFAPAPGRLDRFRPPGGPFTRVDTHGHTGYLVSPHYDSLLAKVAVWAPDRDAAWTASTGRWPNSTWPVPVCVPRFRSPGGCCATPRSGPPGTPPPWWNACSPRPPWPPTGPSAAPKVPRPASGPTAPTPAPSYRGCGRRCPTRAPRPTRPAVPPFAPCPPPARPPGGTD